VSNTATGARERLWSPVRLRSFRMLWLGQSLSLFGDGFSYIAFTWITLSLTHSTLTLGYILALQAIPRTLLTLVGGSFSDKWSARVLMAFSSWSRALLMLAVAVLGLSDRLNLPMICVAAAGFGAVDAFFQPARSSILPSVVESELLPPANALLSVASRVASVIGPAIGGVVVAVSNANYAFLVDSACFALCGVARVSSRPKGAIAESGESAAPATADDSLVRRIRAGLAYAWNDPRLRTMLVFDTVITFCYAGPFTVGFAELAKFRLQGGSTTLGLLEAALAVGAMLGALVGGAVGGQPRVGVLVAVLAAWLAVGMAGLSVVQNTAGAVMVVLVMGFAIGYQGVFGLSWIQRNIDGAILSRVLSVDMVLGYAAAPISLVVCGALAQARASLMFGGTAAILAVTALGVLSSKAVRQMK
jgi:MFS family permease